MSRRDRVDPRVKPLVEIFRGLGAYATVINSSPGNFEHGEASGVNYAFNEPAYIRFHVRNEREFEEVVRAILVHTKPPHLEGATVEVKKVYHTVPDELPILQWYWSLEIAPQHPATEKEMEASVEKAVVTITDIIRRYTGERNL